MNMATEEIGVFIGLFVLGSIAFDVEIMQEGRRMYSRSFRWNRMVNWLPLGIAYAAFYMARYNIAAGNISSVRNELNASATDMGWIISSGSWAYAITAPITGRVTDHIGGRNGMLLACVGAGICNLILGLFFVYHSSSLVLSALIFAANVSIQGFGTSGAMKVIGAWYRPTERGLFSGVFNIFVSSGYFLALGSGHSIITGLGWPYLFFIPSLMLFIMSIVIFFIVHDAPATIPSEIISTPSPKKPQRSFYKLLQNRTLLGYLASVFCLSWARDGLLNWMYSFFDALREAPLTPDEHAVLGGAWTLGGFVGGLLCGWISDTCFQSRRTPPIVLFSLIQTICFFALYSMASYLPIMWLGFLVFLVSVFLLGNYTLLNYAVPTDLPPDDCASATGLITAVGYISTGLAGVVMGSCIESFGYSFWITSLYIASLATGLCAYTGSYFAHLDQLAPESAPLQHHQRRSRTASLVGVDIMLFDDEENVKLLSPSAILMVADELSKTGEV